MIPIFLENKCSPGVLSRVELNKIAAALQHQATYDFNTSPWVEYGYCKRIEVKLLTSGAPPAGSWNIIFLDSISVEGALGYHEDVNGTKIPVSYVAVKETREDNASVCEVASHEMVECATNPFVNVESEMRIAHHEGKEYIVEIADPVEGCGYHAPNGELLANFVWPKWFGLKQIRPNLAQKEGYITSPFTLAPQGYISIKEPGQEWSQIYGYRRSTLPKWSNRLHRAGTVSNSSCPINHDT